MANTNADTAWRAELIAAANNATKAGQVMKAQWMIQIVRRHRPELSEDESLALASTALRQAAERYTQEADALEKAGKPLTKVADLAAFKRRFVRAKFGPECLLEGETTQADLDADQDTFFTGIVCAEMAANHDEIDCAACGSKDICRTPMTKPDLFGTMTTASGAMYGYALCEPCKADWSNATKRVDAAFDEARGAGQGK